MTVVTPNLLLYMDAYDKINAAQLAEQTPLTSFAAFPSVQSFDSWSDDLDTLITSHRPYRPGDPQYEEVFDDDHPFFLFTKKRKINYVDNSRKILDLLQKIQRSVEKKGNLHFRLWKMYIKYCLIYIDQYDLLSEEIRNKLLETVVLMCSSESRMLYLADRLKNKSDSLLRNKAADIYAHFGEDEKALEVLEQSLTTEDDYIRLCGFYTKTGDTRRATEALESCLPVLKPFPKQAFRILTDTYKKRKDTENLRRMFDLVCTQTDDIEYIISVLPHFLEYFAGDPVEQVKLCVQMLTGIPPELRLQILMAFRRQFLEFQAALPALAQTEQEKDAQDGQTDGQTEQTEQTDQKDQESAVGQATPIAEQVQAALKLSTEALAKIDAELEKSLSSIKTFDKTIFSTLFSSYSTANDRMGIRRLFALVCKNTPDYAFLKAVFEDFLSFFADDLEQQISLYVQLLEVCPKKERTALLTKEREKQKELDRYRRIRAEEERLKKQEAAATASASHSAQTGKDQDSGTTGSSSEETKRTDAAGTSGTTENASAASEDRRKMTPEEQKVAEETTRLLSAAREAEKAKVNQLLDEAQNAGNARIAEILRKAEEARREEERTRKRSHHGQKPVPSGRSDSAKDTKTPEPVPSAPEAPPIVLCSSVPAPEAPASATAVSSDTAGTTGASAASSSASSTESSSTAPSDMSVGTPSETPSGPSSQSSSQTPSGSTAQSSASPSSGSIMLTGTPPRPVIEERKDKESNLARTGTRAVAVTGSLEGVAPASSGQPSETASSSTASSSSSSASSQAPSDQPDPATSSASPEDTQTDATEQPDPASRPPLPRGLVRAERPTGTAIRTLHNLSQMSEDEFARRLNITKATLKRWEQHRGAMRLRADSVSALISLQNEILKKLGY